MGSFDFGSNMKKMKGVSPYGAHGYEDQRALIKFQSLLQDFEELYKETEAKKRKLEKMKQRKLTLFDEVRFLRRRYRYLTENQSMNLSSGRKSAYQQASSGIGGKSEKKQKSCPHSKGSMRCPAPRPNSNQKRKIYKEKAVMSQSPAAILDVNQRQNAHMEKEAELLNAADTSFSSWRERISSGKESTVRNPVPFFDLNQISREEEELQAHDETTRLEESQINFMSDGNDEQQNDLKLSAACRSIGGGSSQAGKRKISWQDPVALRV